MKRTDLMPNSRKQIVKLFIIVTIKLFLSLLDSPNDSERRGHDGASIGHGIKILLDLVLTPPDYSHVSLNA